jgi:UDP-N-acetylmuramoyl-L-alanyl-D-glutamate--2,6-diaminopimelate ligase
MSVSLDALAERGLLREIRGDGRTRVQGAAQDSRRVEAGDLFLAISGTRTDGARFVKDAIGRGAVAVAAAEPLEGLSVPTAVFCHPAREAVMLLSNAVYGDATRELVTIGVTGTNGKTTTTWLLDEALGALGHAPALLGTVEARGPGYRDPSALTTPEADTTERFARRMKDAGATHLVMEVSSHALAQERVDGVGFEVVAFSNLTQDHLDFHGSMEAYFQAKARLFFELLPSHAVVNVDDPAGQRLAERLRAAVPSQTTVTSVSSQGKDAEVRALSITARRTGMIIEAATPYGALHIESPLLGGHNVDNLLLAAGCVLASSRTPRPSMEALGHALSSAKGAPGRLERVAVPRDVAILVDYAHSPDALEKALIALRPITPGRLLCVFGCGGDRDKGKRPLMGAVAAAHADLVFVTSDNPRTEDPAHIVREIEPGLSGMERLDAPSATSRGYLPIVDRRTAIRAAIAAARPGDTVLIAGKGHEDYQILGTEKIHFDDREEARAAVDLVTKGGA